MGNQQLDSEKANENEGANNASNNIFDQQMNNFDSNSHFLNANRDGAANG